MTKTLATALISIVAALSLTVAAATPALAQGDCLSRGDIQNAVGNGDIRPLPSVLANNGIDPDAEVLNVKVCDLGGLFYVVTVLDSSGEAQNLTLNAQ